MKPEELYKEINDGKIRSVYYLFGDDDYIKDESYAKIREAVLKGAIPDFNSDIFYGGEVEVSRLLSAASTLPVMASRRLVVLRDADRLKAAEEAELLPYLEAPSPETTLLLTGRSVDKRKKFFLAIGRNGAAVEHSPPYEREMPKWIRWVAKKRGFHVSDEACAFLVDIIGNDIAAVANEIEKVSLYVGDRKNIELEDIEAISVDLKSRTVFQLIDAIGTKNLKSSLENLKKLLEGGESTLLILSMILRQIRLIWTALDILNKGGREADVKKVIKLPPFVFNGLFKQVKLFREKDLKDAYEEIFELDLKFKSTRIDQERALELLMFRLCGFK